MRKNILFLLMFSFFVSLQVSSAADLKQLAEQLVNLTVKEVESVKPAGGDQAGPAKAIREGGRTVGAGQIREAVNKLLYKTDISKVLDAYNTADKERLIREIIAKNVDKERFCKYFPELCDEFKNPASNLRAGGPPPYKILPHDNPCIRLLDEDADGDVYLEPPINEPCDDVKKADNNGGLPGLGNSTFPNTRKADAKKALDAFANAKTQNKLIIEKEGANVKKEKGVEDVERRGLPGMENSTFSKARTETAKNAIRNVNRQAIEFAIEKGNKSETAKKVLQAILESKIPCANCEGIEKLPEREVSKIAKAQERIQKEGWKVEVKDGKVKVKKTQKRKLFFLFNVEVEQEGELGESGEIANVKNPWWSIFAW